MTNHQDTTNIKIIRDYDLINSREKLRNIRDGIESYYVKWEIKKEQGIIKSPVQLEIRRCLLNSAQLINRAASIVGGSLIFAGAGDNNSPYTKAGGIIAIVAPVIETSISLLKTKLFEDEEKKLGEFLEGATKEIWDLYFQYSKLEEIIKPIKQIKDETGNLPKGLNSALSSVESRVGNFLKESYEIIGEREIANKEKEYADLSPKEKERADKKLEEDKRKSDKNKNWLSSLSLWKGKKQEEEILRESKSEKREKFPLRLWSHWEDYKHWLLEGGVELVEEGEKITKVSIKEEVESLLKELDNYLYSNKEERLKAVIVVK